MNTPAAAGRSGRMERTLGVVLLAQFALQAWVKLDTAAAVELLWLSNVGLLMAAAGLLLRVVPLVAVALLWVAVPHAMWALDFAGLLTTGDARLGIVTYWPAADLAVRAGTVFHLYLAPVLLVVVLRRGVRLRPWLPVAAVLFLVLAVVSRVLGDAKTNVNWVYGVELYGGFGIVDRFNGLPSELYLLALAAVMTLGAFLPTAIVTDAMATAGNGSAIKSPRSIDAGFAVRSS